MGYQNFYTTRLATDIGAADTSITLETPPTQTSGRLVLEARNATQREIIAYTNVSGNQITGVTRGLGGTTAKTHIKNSLVEMNLTAEDIADLYAAFQSFAASTNDWRTIAAAVSGVTAFGQRSYEVTFSGVDLRTILTPGMRLKMTRNTAAPIRSALLNGTNQYFSKAAPAGMTVTDDITVTVFCKLTQYGGLISRYNGTSGFQFYTTANGQVVLVGNNGGAGNYSQVISQQSVPLNRWVRVTACLDMSAFTATPTTSWIMIDDIDTPALVQRAGTNPTALIQAGDFQIGAVNGASFAGGEIAQAAIFSAKITQATMRSYSSQGLIGTETNLISGFSFDNTLNDLNTTNANNLSAINGAVFNNADSPFGTQADNTISANTEYGIVMLPVVYSAGNSVVTVQAPEGCMIPTTGGLSAVSYSAAKAPHGMPRQAERWQIWVPYASNINSSFGSVNSWHTSPGQVMVPAGAWKVGYQGNLVHTSSVSGLREGQWVLCPTAEVGAVTASTLYDSLKSYILTFNSNYGLASTRKELPVTLSAQKLFALQAFVASSTGAEGFYFFRTALFADNAYL